MWVRELELQNWMLIRHANLTFSKGDGILGVIGRYADSKTEGSSNRAGKTTLVEAIRYLLFGKGRSASGSKLTNRAARAEGEGFYLRGAFVLRDGSTFTVERARDAKGKPSVMVDGEQMKVKEADERIYELVGWTPDEYENAGYFEQGDIHKFMTSQPREKRELLMSWMNLDRWEARRSHASEQATLYAGKVESVQTALSSLPTVDRSTEELELDVATSTKHLAKAKKARTRHKKKVDRLLKALEEAVEQARIAEQMEKLEAELERYRGLLEDAESNADAADQLRAEMEALEVKKTEAVDAKQERITALSEQMATVKAEVDTLAIKAEALEDAGGVCPVLGMACDKIAEDEDNPFNTEVELEEKEKALKGLSLERVKVVHEKGKLRKSYDDRIEAKQEALRKLGNVDTDHFGSEVSRVEEQMAEVEEEYEQNATPPSQVRAKLRTAREAMDGAEEDVNDETRRLALAEAELKTAVDHEQRRAKLEKRLVAVRKGLSAWTYCSYMFSNRGIPGEYISTAFEVLEGDVNYIMRRMDTGMQVEFKPYRTGKKKEASCLACGHEFKPREKRCPSCSEVRHMKQVEQLVLNIHDEREGQESEFSMDSGGGKVVISFAVRLALFMLKVRESGGEVPPIVLDEIVGFLDGPNRAAVIDVVINILTQEFGVQQVWWISHNEEILDMIDNPLVVMRHDNHSTVDWD